jgi:hypothetical protein
MQKFLFIFVFLYSLFSFSQTEKIAVIAVLNQWHNAAAKANYDEYFSHMSKTSAFIGTDATENWQVEAFKVWSKPYFDKGKAWSFTCVERNIYFSEDKKTAWFDELLSTQMKICRGSGVLIKEQNQWKIAHYVLSITIPNNDVDNVVKIKSKFDDKLLQDLKAKKQP